MTDNMQRDAKVSVIVPCYNYADFLGEAVDSVLEQTYPHWECIIINDGSPDNTEEVALQYCKKDSRIKYFYKENGGHSSARNFGIKQSKGKYILPLDADDKINKDYLEKAVAILENEKNVKIVTGQVQLFGNTKGKLLMPPFDLRSFLIVNCISITSLFRRIDYDKTEGFDETMLAFEDWDFFISLLKEGGIVKELPCICLYYRKKEVSMYQNVLKNNTQSFKDLLKLYNNNIDIYERYFNSPIGLIQENEKMKVAMESFYKTKTHKLIMKFNNLNNRMKTFLRLTSKAKL